MSRKKLCIVTGTRAEYGLLYPLLNEIKREKDFRLQLVATGMHLSPDFGLTYREIEKDGFRIDGKVEMLLSSDSPVGIAKSIGLGISGFADVFERLGPDILVLLGDRFEIFAAATVAMTAGIPIAHIHGGELTEGLIDEPIRHSITKMAHLHFTSTAAYRQRVIQLGEDPGNVFAVGALGIDNIKSMRLLPRKKLEGRLGFNLKRKNILVTFHPVTLEKNTSGSQFAELLAAIDDLEDMGIIFTKPNADMYGRAIIEKMDSYVEARPGKAVSFMSMGQLLYLSTMRHVDAIVGNSSSGIIEAPSFGIPTVNIGDRQRGRIKAESVIDCKPNKKAISRALRRAFSEDFKKIRNPYGEGNAAKKIVRVLKRRQFSQSLIMKRFYDIRF